MSLQNSYLKRAGATFRGLINDLKRNEQAAAQDLGVSETVIREIIAGERPITTEILEKAVRVWPVNERDFFPIHDDTEEGVVVMRRADSAASSRVFQRAGFDYYEYRDTAMSRVAMIRPEWIKMLHVVTDNDAENPGVQWNNGHFLFQFTYFVGEVNYYYSWNDRKFCEPMTTGDSVFGLPFAKHSFASRNAQSPALILALTYGGRLLGDAQHEIGILGEELASKFVLPLNDPAQASAGLLRFHVSNGSYSADYLAAASGIAEQRLEKALHGEMALEPNEIQSLAGILRISPRELLITPPDTRNGVVIVHHKDAPSWLLSSRGTPCYRIHELAGSRVMPFSRSLEIEVLPGAETECALETGLHQYGYNLGPSPVSLGWRYNGIEHHTVIGPEESFCIKPHISHWYQPSEPTSNAPSRLLVLRVGGKVVGDAILEASLVGREALGRVVAETMCWYNPKGSHEDDALPLREEAPAPVSAGK